MVKKHRHKWIVALVLLHGFLVFSDMAQCNCGATKKADERMKRQVV